MFRPDRKEKDDQEIRVTDRRRIYLDDEGERTNEAVPKEPNLKPTYVEELEARTKAAENKAQEVQSRFEQLKGELRREMDETRQRLNRAADERAQRENANFVAALLPVLDNLMRATESADTATLENVIEGVRHTAENFERALLAAGVEPIPAVGEPFDPELHEAVDTTNAGPEMEGRVVAEYTRGYRMGDRLLRPARVQVGSGASVKSDSAGG